MPLSKIRRFLYPPKCLELDRLSPANEDPLFLLRNDLRDEDSSPVYVIRQNGAGRGLFSLVSSVVCHLHLAARHGLMPIVDLRDSPTEYDDQQFLLNDCSHRSNPWEFFFQPVSSLRLDEGYENRTCLASAKGFPLGYPRKMLISHSKALREIASACIKPASDILDELDIAISNILEGNRVLGVHFRGQEQKTTPYHPLSPTHEQIYAAIDLAITDYDYNRIFVASEDQDFVDAVMDRYSGKAIALPHFRTRSPVNSYRIYPRPMHKYLLGKEILIDAFILSDCDGLVSSTSNVTEFARSRNNGKYQLDLVIDNGLNATNPLVAKHLWMVKRMLPERMGGFSANAIQPFPPLLE